MDTVELHVHGGWEEVPCIPTPVPGLVLVHYDGLDAVVHARSGGAVGVFDSAEKAAQFVLEVIEPLGHDWTTPANSWGFGLHARVVSAARRFGAVLHGDPATPEARAR